MLALIFLALGVSTTVQLTDDVYAIPAEPGWWLPVMMKDPGQVSAQFDARSDGAKVRLTLMSYRDLWQMRNGRPYDVIAQTETVREGRLAHRVPRRGQYALVIDHGEHSAVDVHMRVDLDFTPPAGISNERKLTVIAASFAFFFSVVTFSARRLLRSVRR